MTRAALLVIGPEPPPWSGMEVSTKIMVDELRRAGVPFRRVDTADPGGTEGREQWNLHNVLLGLKHVAQVALALARRDVSAVYVPVSQGLPGYYRDAAFLLLGRVARKPLIVHIHGGAFCRFYAAQRPPIRVLIRATAGNAALAIVLSEHLRYAIDCLVRNERIRAVPIGVDDAYADHVPEAHDGELRLLFLSILLREKGVLVFVEALGRACRRRPFIRATVAGQWFDPVVKGEVERLVDEYDLDGHIDFVGVVSGERKHDLLRSADLFCLPTFYPLEGTPSVICEALGASNPVLATNWAGIPDLVHNGVEGLLLAEPDPEAFADAIVELADDPERRLAMARAARARYEREFTREAFGERIVAVLRPFVSAGEPSDAPGGH